MRTKKFISALMALVMLFGVFAISVNAWTGADVDQSIKIVTTADKTVVNPGDTVNFTIKLYFSNSSNYENALGNTAISWMYNTSQITPTTLTYGSELGNFSLQRPIGKIVAASPLNAVKAASTPEEQARYDANGYDAICKLQGMKDAASPNGAIGFWRIVDGEVVHTLTCKVSDTVAPGTEINFDVISGLFAKNHTAFQFADTANNNKMAYKYGSKYYDASEAAVKLTVAGGEQPAAPVLNKDGRQVKMSVQSGAVVKGTEQLRVISSISKADWDANFAQTATADTTKNAIQKVGIVANNGTVPFDMTTAQNVAKGTPADGYSVAETTYIQQAADDTYKFGARIEYKTDVYDTTYVAFVEYTDAQGVTQYMFYDAEASVAFKTNYKTITDQYIAKFPG